MHRIASLIVAGALSALMGCACPGDPQDEPKDMGSKDGDGKESPEWVAKAEQSDDKLWRFTFDDLPSNQATGQPLVAVEGEEAEFVDAQGQPVRKGFRQPPKAGKQPKKKDKKAKKAKRK